MGVYSYVMGRLSSMNVPSPVLAPFLKLYSRWFHVNMDDLPKPLHEYSSFKDFFTRQLRTGQRIVNSRTDTIVSPVDGTILDAGSADSPVANTFRIKNRYYMLEELLGKMAYYDFRCEDMTGVYMTFYLDPGSYHRIHAPMSGNISLRSFSPGTLFPVNGIGRKLNPDYHIKNSRVTIKLSSPDGKVHIFMVLIGALGVGNILLTYNGTQDFSPGDKGTFEMIDPPIPVEKGQEIGIFNMGSSVFVLCYCSKDEKMAITAQAGRIQMGSSVIESPALGGPGT
ncbi:MAG: archaetidylserine decarboxylase [Pseudomonadota bacterium]